MAMHGSKRLLEVAILSMFVVVSACRSLDLNMLQAMKASIIDQSQSLNRWNSSISFCKWDGIACFDSSHVSEVKLPRKNLSGRITESIFRIPQIQFIDLSSNQFFGEIPWNLSSCYSLKYLNLSNNNLTGPIPRGHFPVLETFDLSNNFLSGEIPGDIGLLSGLNYLDFGGNILSGNVPDSIANMTSLEILTLASNQLTGEIPPKLGFMKRLRWIYLGHNNFSGRIPVEIGELTALNHLDLVGNNLTGEIPSSLGNLTNLRELFLYSNMLTGSIPNPIFNLKNLVSLDLSCNFLSGEIPELTAQLRKLEILHLFSNNFSGKIPNALSSLPNLQFLQLWSNGLSGEIPADLGMHNNLIALDLSSNNLTGIIPRNLCASGRLSKLILFSNSLEGKIPESLSFCKSLQRLRLQQNRLSGELSPELTKLPLVYYLDMSNNNLSGRIDDRKWNMPHLQMLNLAGNMFFRTLPNYFGSKKLERLDLCRNNFSGSIPGSFGEFSELTELKLSENKLAGQISDRLSNCKKLVTLDLSHNHLVGQIPRSFAALPVLGQLDLSVNDLTGMIPSDLGEVESLVQVNVSHNHLHGRLPATGAFLAINSSAVVGNKLCGNEKTSGLILPPCNSAKGHVRWFVLAFLLSSMIMFGVVVFLSIFIRKRTSSLELKRLESEDGTWEMQFLNSSRISRSVAIKDILSSIRPENIVASGRTGKSYKGKSSLSNEQFLAKEVTSILAGHWVEWSRLCKISHRNVVKLLGICRSEKNGILLVYEYIEGKDLSEVIRGLSWERRLKVALGVARALEYLHYLCSPSITAVDVTPRRIMVDAKGEARLRLSLPCSDKGFNSDDAAPGANKRLAEKSDIYGFGLLLIELMTGKSPDDAELGVHRNLVDWARYCYSDCHLEMWVDAMTDDREVAGDSKNQIVGTMNLALQCTAGDPAARPRADNLVKGLESIVRSRMPCFFMF